VCTEGKHDDRTEEASGDSQIGIGDAPPDSATLADDEKPGDFTGIFAYGKGNRKPHQPQTRTLPHAQKNGFRSKATAGAAGKHRLELRMERITAEGESEL
jgi:hypothetical protein